MYLFVHFSSILMLMDCSQAVVRMKMPAMNILVKTFPRHVFTYSLAMVMSWTQGRHVSSFTEVVSLHNNTVCTVAMSETICLLSFHPCGT